MFFLFPFINLCFINCRSEINDIDPRTLNKLETEISQETPLEFATRTLRSHFDNEHFDSQFSDPNGIHKTSTEKSTSRTEVFNKSFMRYIKDVYNKRDYSEVLSQDGSHIIEFLKLCNELNLNASSAYVGIRLFRIKMTSCEIIDDTVVLQLLEELPNQMARYFEKKKKNIATENNVLSRNIEKIILGRLNNQFDGTSASMDELKTSLTNEISKYVFDEIKKMKEKKSAKKNKARLRSEVIRFFETLLARMLWNPKTPETIWPSFLEIANGMQSLAVNNIINHMDDLDSLLWALVLRFNFFLDLSGYGIPLDIYTEIESALNDGSIFFLESQEQDEGVRGKKELLAEALFRAKTKAFAYHKKGILPQYYNI